MWIVKSDHWYWGGHVDGWTRDPKASLMFESEKSAVLEMHALELQGFTMLEVFFVLTDEVADSVAVYGATCARCSNYCPDAEVVSGFKCYSCRQTNA